MKEKRFAVVTCKNEDNYAVTCGGASMDKEKAYGNENLDSCDVHNLYDLERMALKAVAATVS